MIVKTREKVIKVYIHTYKSADCRQCQCQVFAPMTKLTCASMTVITSSHDVYDVVYRMLHKIHCDSYKSCKL